MNHVSEHPPTSYPDWLRMALYAMSLLQLLLLSISIPGHSMHIDEAWIGEQAYMLERDGHVHSDLFEGLAGHERETIVYHRLFVRAGSVAISLFSWNLWSLRLVSIVSSFLLCSLLWMFARRHLRWSTEEIVLLLSIFLLVPLNFLFIKIYRPEIMMSMFGFASYYALALSSRRSDARICIPAGVLAGCALLSHPYGLIFTAAGLGVLLWSRRWTGIAFFLVAALVSLVPYLYDIIDNLVLVQEQMTNPIVAGKTTFTLLSPLTNLLAEHQRLFRRPEIILVTILFLLSVILNVEGGRRNDKSFYIYALLLVLFLGALAQDKVVTRYAIPLLPFFCMEIALAARAELTKQKRPAYLRIPFLITLCLFVGYGIYYQVNDAFYTRGDVAGLNSRIGAHLTDGERVVGPMNLIFNQIERVDIIGLYLANKEEKNYLTLRRVLDFASRHNAGVIVFNRYATDEEQIVDLDSAVSVGTGFEVLHHDSDYTVLRLAR